MRHTSQIASFPFVADRTQGARRQAMKVLHICYVSASTLKTGGEAI